MSLCLLKILHPIILSRLTKCTERPVQVVAFALPKRDFDYPRVQKYILVKKQLRGLVPGALSSFYFSTEAFRQ